MRTRAEVMANADSTIVASRFASDCKKERTKSMQRKIEFETLSLGGPGPGGLGPRPPWL
jgi:hypothetical protein